MTSRLLSSAGLRRPACRRMFDDIRRLDSINPFASSGPKMAQLEPVSPTIDVRDQWSASIGKAGDYTFTPAVVGNAVYRCRPQWCDQQAG